jgi:pimeloyl-ACP methyl ester carboxylesterase
MRFVRHHHVDLALHELRVGSGRPLLLLHGLGSQTPSTEPSWTSAWPGPVLGLDFTGHGESTVPVGGGYSAEVLMGDVDAVLAQIGTCTVLGQGLGAYIALLIAGARPRLVRGAILADGSGSSGGVAGPSSGLVVESLPGQGVAPDPWARFELSRDPRPADYAISFVRQTVILSGLTTPLAVCAHWRPAWMVAVADDPAVLDVSLDEALATFAAIP